MIQKLFDNEAQQGLLAFAPFFLVASSLLIGFKIGLFAVSMLFLQTAIIFSICHLVPIQQRFPIILIVSISIILIARMFLNAEVYSTAEQVGLFLPLLVFNSLVLSVTETAFSRKDFKSLLGDILDVGIVILSFFLIFPFLISLLDEVLMFASTASCLFLAGFLFATINFLKARI